MDEYRRKMRMFGIVGTVVPWGIIGIILLLMWAKDVVTGQTPEPKLVACLVAAIVTVVGTLMGDTPRRVVGSLWLIVAILGLLAFVVGAGGLGIEWMVMPSLGMLVSGLFSAYTIFLPDRNK